MTTLPHKIGPYQVERELGRGGMGVVYLARDTKLDRRVAIKALPENLAADPDRLARFEREAKVLASLNHPGIGAIYGLESGDAGARYLVLEFIEGQTLADRLARGPIPVPDALELARQIAEALETAHDKGVIHRDLKPGNVMVTPEGKVKVLDFGLARTATGEHATTLAGISPDSPTLTTPIHSPTIPGAIMGSAGYMSPEQVRGKPVDKRSDIFSFGILLFEMLTGDRPFHGETVSDSIGATLHKELNLSRLPPGAPPSLRRVLTRCLAKDRQQRLHDIADARIELTAILHGEEQASQAPAAPATRRAPALLAGAVLGAILMSLAAWLAFGLRAPAPRTTTLEIAAVGRVGYGLSPISPDGKWVAYTTVEGIWLRALDQLKPRMIPGTAGADHVFWAPDSQRLGYFFGTRIYRTSLDGGVAVVCEVPEETEDIAGGGWSEDDIIVFTMGQEMIYRVPARGGEATVIRKIDPDSEEDFHEVSVLPGGAVMFVIHRLNAGGDTIAVIKGEEEKTILQLPKDLVYEPTYSRSGHILFQRTLVTPGIWAVPFSLSSLEVTGDPFLVAKDGADPSVSRDRTLVYHPSMRIGANVLARFNRDGSGAETIGSPQVFMSAPRFSPDERTIAVCAMEHGNRDIWLTEIERGIQTRLTFGPEDEMLAVWEPTGNLLAISSGWQTRHSWRLQRQDSRDAAEVVSEGRLVDFSADGRFAVGECDGAICMWTLSPAGEEGGKASAERTVLIDPSARARQPSLSPDAQFMAYFSDRSGRAEVYVTRFPSAKEQWRVSADGGEDPRWTRGGRELIFSNVRLGAMMAAAIETTPEFKVGAIERLFTAAEVGIDPELEFDVTPDGSKFVSIRSGDGAPSAGIVVVSDWLAPFKNSK